jgi:hypothetical protein
LKLAFDLCQEIWFVVNFGDIWQKALDQISRNNCDRKRASQAGIEYQPRVLVAKTLTSPDSIAYFGVISALVEQHF